MSLEYYPAPTRTRLKPGLVHSCKKCSYLTSSLFSIKNHVKRHLANKLELFDCAEGTPETLTCKECNYATHQTLTLRDHIVNHKWFKCDQCSFTTQLEHNLKTHIVAHNSLDKLVKKCEKCDFETLDLSHFERHKRECVDLFVSRELIECSRDVPYFYCDKCPRRSRSRVYIQRHREKVHGDSIKEIEFVDIKGERFKCDKCEFETSTLYFWKEHTEHECAEYSIENKYYMCKKCEYKSANRHHFFRHNKLRHGTNLELFSCEQCAYQTKLKHNLRKHVEVVHSDQMYQCDQCPAQSKHLVYLKRHKAAKHSDPDKLKWHACDHCPYKTIYKNHLTTHQQLHSKNPQWFKCASCPYKTCYKAYLKRHKCVRYVDLRHMCEKCPFQTKYSNVLKTHLMFKHASDVEGSKCELCNFKFKRKEALRDHVLYKHSAFGEIEWVQCGLCPFKAKSKKQVEVHRLTHSGGRVACQMCEYTTSCVAYLKRHLEKKHCVASEQKVSV